MIPNPIGNLSKQRNCVSIEYSGLILSFQIELGKSTPEYGRYVQEVPIDQRGSPKEHPRTPDRSKKYRLVWFDDNYFTLPLFFYWGRELMKKMTKRYYRWKKKKKARTKEKVVSYPKFCIVGLRAFTSLFSVFEIIFLVGRCER